MLYTHTRYTNIITAQKQLGNKNVILHKKLKSNHFIIIK